MGKMAVSFSQDAKNDVCRIAVKYPCCRRSLLYGILYGGSEFSRERIRLSVENEEVRRIFERLYKSCFKKSVTCDDGKYQLETHCDEIFGFFGYAPETDACEIQEQIFTCQFCAWSFIRGVFLCCGTVAAPKNEYHLEMIFKDEERARAFAALLDGQGMSPKIVYRDMRGAYGVYYKESELIEDFLTRIGAQKAAFDFMNAKIYKDIANGINRRNNFDTANMEKSITASQKQMKAIYDIIDGGFSDMLSDELKETLDLRAANPEASLVDLAAMHNPPLTKSGVNHRLKKIVDFAGCINGNARD